MYYIGSGVWGISTDLNPSPNIVSTVVSEINPPTGETWVINSVNIFSVYDDFFITTSSGDVNLNSEVFVHTTYADGRKRYAGMIGPIFFGTDYAIYYFSGLWKIYDYISERTLYTNNNSASLIPPLTGWVATNGANPPPVFESCQPPITTTTSTTTTTTTVPTTSTTTTTTAVPTTSTTTTTTAVPTTSTTTTTTAVPTTSTTTTTTAVPTTSTTTTTPSPCSDTISLLLEMNGNNNTFIDSSINSHTITAVGTVTQSTDQVSPAGGKVAYFDGNGYLDCNVTSGSLVGSSDFTIEAWIYLTSAVSGATIISNRANSNLTAYLKIGVYNNKPYALVGENLGTWPFYDSNMPDIQLNTWHKISFSRNNSNNNFAFRFNDNLVSSINVNVRIGNNNSSSLIIGAENVGGSMDNKWIGYIDNVEIKKICI
jgi:cytoskeletal protein RodZ